MGNGIYFVTRLKSNAKIELLEKRRGRKAKGVSVDRTIKLGNITEPLRMVSYQDPETGKELSFVTNAHPPGGKDYSRALQREMAD